MEIFLVGGGNLLYFLSRSLLSKGHKLTIIEKDPQLCTWLARQLKATIVQGDGSVPQVLEDAGIRHADSVFTLTPHDEDNLIICQLAMAKYGVPSVFSLVNDPDNQEIFHRLGIKKTLSIITLLSRLIEEKAYSESVSNVFSVAEGQVNVTELLLESSSPAVGRALKDLPLPADSLIAGIVRQGQAIVPHGRSMLEAEDKLIVISNPENYAKVLSVLLGEEKA